MFYFSYLPPQLYENSAERGLTLGLISCLPCQGREGINICKSMCNVSHFTTLHSLQRVSNKDAARCCTVLVLTHLKYRKEARTGVYQGSKGGHQGYLPPPGLQLLFWSALRSERLIRKIPVILINTTLPRKINSLYCLGKRRKLLGVLTFEQFQCCYYYVMMWYHKIFNE